MRNRDERYDVAVVGGGAAGLAAAVGAARTGARTLLVERYGFLGGAATQGQVLSYCGFYKQGPLEPEQTVVGVGDEVLAALRQLGMDTTPVRARSGNWIVMLDTEAVKLAFDRVAASTNVNLRLHTLVVGATCAGGALESITLADHGGPCTVTANAFVDASGEADLAHLAGLPMATDSSAGAHVQPASLPIRIGGVATGTAVRRDVLSELIARYNERQGGGLTRADGGVLVRLPISGDLWTMAVDINTGGLHGDDLSRAETRARALAWDFVQLLRQTPGCERAYLVATGPQLGIRESRRPHAVRDVSSEDGRSGRLRPADGVARASWPMEVHEAPGRARFTPIGGQGHFDIGHDALVARDLPNLRLAGRVIGADAEVYGSVRVMGTAFATGHAAGVSAALHRHGEAPRIAQIRAALEAQRALI
jgi:FAD dependent oxidoreductase